MGMFNQAPSMLLQNTIPAGPQTADRKMGSQMEYLRKKRIEIKPMPGRIHRSGGGPFLSLPYPQETPGGDPSARVPVRSTGESQRAHPAPSPGPPARGPPITDARTSRTPCPDERQCLGFFISVFDKVAPASCGIPAAIMRGNKNKERKDGFQKRYVAMPGPQLRLRVRSRQGGCEYRHPAGDKIRRTAGQLAQPVLLGLQESLPPPRWSRLHDGEIREGRIEPMRNKPHRRHPAGCRYILSPPGAPAIVRP